MRREIHDLVEAVRALGVRLTGHPAPQCIRLAGDPSDFAERLAFLQERLEAADASGALADDGGPAAPAPDDEAARLRKALDGLLRYVQVRGVDMDEAVDIVADALGLEAGNAKKGAAYVTLPKFAPKGWKKRKGFKPRLKLLPDSPGDASINGLRRMAFEASMTTALLGSTVRGRDAGADDAHEHDAPARSAP